MGNQISNQTTEHQLDLPNSQGTIKGLKYDTKAIRYAGVPYALPSTGEHRWRKPRPLPASYTYFQPDGTPFNGTEFAPVCPQAKFESKAETDGSKTIYSEFCLRLNIWTSVSTPENKGKWPVMIWLNGGWFQLGDPSQEEGMNPTELISTGNLNTMFIAIGHRLKIFGFLAGEALREENGDEELRNYGLWDQRLAMEWIRDNVSSFGGDPGNVTHAGRSVGSCQDLHDFRTSPGQAPEKSLFHRFFIYSNAIPSQPRPLEESQPQFDEVCSHFKIFLSARCRKTCIVEENRCERLRGCD